MVLTANEGSYTCHSYSQTGSVFQVISDDLRHSHAFRFRSALTRIRTPTLLHVRHYNALADYTISSVKNNWLDFQSFWYRLYLLNLEKFFLREKTFNCAKRGKKASLIGVYSKIEFYIYINVFKPRFKWKENHMLSPKVIALCWLDFI